jgi:hypothetical protein
MVKALILAAVVWLLLSAQAQPIANDANGQPATAKGNESTRKNASVTADSRGKGGEVKAADGDPDAEQRQQRENERRDLIAQEDMAYWAESMFWAAFAQAVLSFMGIVLIYVTFKEARRAADSGDKMAVEAAAATAAAIKASEAGQEANRVNMREAARNTRRTIASAKETEAALAIATRNADAAAAQVEVARQAHLAQTRPWIFVKDVQIVYENMQKANAVIFFHNFGNWPAANFAKTVRAREVPYPFAAEPLDEPDQSLATLLPPSESETMVADNLPRPKAGYVVRVDAVWSYKLPDGDTESGRETFVIDINMGRASARKMTAYDSANHPAHAKKDK